MPTGSGLGGDKEAAGQLGALLWSRLAAAYIARRLAPAAPENDEQLPGFQRVSAAAQQFESAAASLGCVGPAPLFFCVCSKNLSHQYFQH